MGIRCRIEAGFTRWGRLVVRRRGLALCICLALGAGFVAGLPRLQVDNSTDAFLREGHPVRVRYDRFKDAFEREDRVSIVLRPERVFDAAFLETLRRLHEEIESEVPYVAEVTSLVNARDTRGEGDELIVEDLMERWPEGPGEIAALRERAMANPLYVDALVSADASHTIVAVEPYTYSTLGDGDPLAGFDDGADASDEPLYLTDEESFALVDALEGIVARYRSPELEMHLVGGPTLDRHMTAMMQRDVTVMMSLSFALVVALLFVLFRRVSGVLLPVFVVLLSLLSSLGLMGWLAIPFSVTLNMLPAFLLVVGLCDSIHILTIVYKRLESGRSRDDAIADALGHSGLAVVMTSVTTAAGLASFTFADLAPIAHLGVIAPIGVLLAMLFSLTLLPALLALAPLGERDAPPGAGLRAFFDRWLARAGDLSTRRPWRTVAAAALLVALGLPGVLELRASHNAMRWFPERDPLRRATELIDREFHGSAGLEVIVHTGEENGLYEPATLARLERAMDHASGLAVDGRPIGNVTSIVDVVKEIHQALHENRAELRRIPDRRDLVAQELLLFENSGNDDLEEVVDSRFETARVSIRTPWADAMEYPALLDAIERGFRDALGSGVGLEVTGHVALFTTVFSELVPTMARSYVFALLVITPLMVLLIGNWRRGLLAMIPNLLPIYLVLALMGWSGIPLDASTLLIGGIILGLAVDDTIHFMHKFGRYYEDSGDARRAVHETLATTGVALLFTSLVLSAGFAVMLASYMQNSFWFGALATVATITAFLADVLLAPALMVLAGGAGAAAPR